MREHDNRRFLGLRKILARSAQQGGQIAGRSGGSRGLAEQEFSSRAGGRTRPFLTVLAPGGALLGVFCLCMLGAQDSHQEKTIDNGLEVRPREVAAGPGLLDIIRAHQDLTYDGLLKALPGEPAYRRKLSFDPTKARYYDTVHEELNLTNQEVEVFRRNGFVTLDNGRYYSFTTAYYDIYASDLPVLVTTDSILHALHKSYDAILLELETTWFQWTLEEVLADVHTALQREAQENPDSRLEKNYRDVDLYLTVARNLLGGTQTPQVHTLKVSSALGQDEEVVARLRDIQSLRVPDLNGPRTRIYGGNRFLDWSQFRPRGHYTRSSALENYFRCMMWLGRADTGWNVLPTHSSLGIDSDDRRELRDAVLLVQLLRRTKNLDRLSSIDRVLAYLVGTSDSLNVSQLAELMEQTGVRGVGQLLEGPQVLQLQEAIGRTQSAKQRIRSQIVFSDRRDSDKVPPPATFQMFGQRFTIDSYVLSHVVFDSILFDGQKQERMMPCGLDVATALGNDAAVPLLESELRQWGYSANLLAARKFVDQLDQEFWKANLYSLWLGSLRELDSNLVAEKLAPEVMQTQAWQMKQLQTQLASWSQLRRDTILYAKQSYTSVPFCEYLAGYVEPYPDFYAKIKEFAVQAKALIQNTPYRSCHPKRETQLRGLHQRHLQFFEIMARHIGQLETLARKELAGKPFTVGEEGFVQRTINKRGSTRFGSGSRPHYDGWYTELFYTPNSKPDGRWEATIADVHTAPATNQALQVGVGPVRLCLIAIDNQDDLAAYVGPVFTYYEFQQPADKRLTDQQWQQKFFGAQRPAPPSWVGSFTPPPTPRPNYGTTVTFGRLEDEVHLSVSTRRANGLSARSFKVPLTDDGLKRIADIPHRTLDLSHPKITNQGLSRLRRLGKLRNLNLSSTQVRGHGLAALREAKRLRVLLLRDTQVSDPSLLDIKHLPRLEILDLSGSQVTSECIQHLEEMSSLRQLNLERTAVDTAAIDRLRAALPACQITP